MITGVFPASQPPPILNWAGDLCALRLVLAVLTPVAVFAGGWMLGGAYSGFRDPRLFQLTVVSVSSFALLWMAVLLPYSWFLLARIFFRQFRRPVVGEPR